jgi:nitrous oxide reductase accessory protein NosL
MSPKQKSMSYQAVMPSKATLVKKGDSKKYCNICGMTLPMFYKTSHASKDVHLNHAKQYCSIHCLVEDKETNKANLSELKVVDNKSLKFIDVKDAFYVVGSNKPATMSMVSKYAFAKKEDAINFAKQNGGKVKVFDEVYKEVSAELEAESAMIAKRQKKMQMMGKKVYSKMCKKTDKNFTSVADAKTFITKNKLCGEMKGKKLQAVGIYLGRR